MNLAELESFFEIIDYQETQNGILIQAKNLKVRRSELISELEKRTQEAVSAWFINDYNQLFSFFFFDVKKSLA